MLSTVAPEIPRWEPPIVTKSRESNGVDTIEPEKEQRPVGNPRCGRAHRRTPDRIEANYGYGRLAPCATHPHPNPIGIVKGIPLKKGFNVHLS